MKLKVIQIKNYRSIEDISFEVNTLEDKSYTYGLIGVNEAGKSSILKALSLKDGLSDKEGPLPKQKDFKNTTYPIEIIYFYSPNKEDTSEFKATISENFPGLEVESINFEELILKVSFNHSDPSQKIFALDIKNLTLEEKDSIQENLKPLVISKMHKSIFWTAEDRYLISKPINLAEFATNPGLSIPLENCFILSGFTDIQAEINKIGDSTEKENLEDELGQKVTGHINSAWPKHPIEITFSISDGLINFHVHDLNVKGKAKTADQRSDGFGQFISFLLTISAQNKNEGLSNTIILLDEPETHLHPQAQEDLLRELVNITQNERSNIAFFATHSNYMIDKNDLSRNYRVLKPKDVTEKEQFKSKISTYASVTFEVFDIPGTDYHSELYSRLHEIYQDINPSDENRDNIRNFDDNFLSKEKGLKKEYPWKGTPKQITLPTYIRNCINHPDNGNKYTDVDLRNSIELLRSYF